MHNKGIATEKRTYRIVNLDDGGIGLIEDVENLSSPMFSIINGYAVYSDRIELTFVKSYFTEYIVGKIILKQPGEEWIVYTIDGEYEKYTASSGSITTKNATYDDCIVIKKEMYFSNNELFTTVYMYYAKYIGLVFESIGEGENELIEIVPK